MQVFVCPVCTAPLYFHQLACVCGTEVIFEGDAQNFETAGTTCANRDTIGCNWQAPLAGELCIACAMTIVVPDSIFPANVALWSEAELAKRWVLANLGRWGWFTSTDKGERPGFEMLSEQTAAGRVAVTMGHDAGIVTINVAEADAPTRAARSQAFGERYRTMVGHYRHELGHFLFQRLSENSEYMSRFRSLFGDERADYGRALRAHYCRAVAADDIDDWDKSHVTGYATSHPHEDWAESFAHLLHLVDITDSFMSAGLSGAGLSETYDAYRDDDANVLISAAADLSLALNHVARSMGVSDIYPFVLSGAVREKLAFVHHWVRAGAA